MRLRRADAARSAASDAEYDAGDDFPSIDDLSGRVRQLEQVVEELQDSVHRHSVRHDDELDKLQRLTKPAEIARALAQDARARGL